MKKITLLFAALLFLLTADCQDKKSPAPPQDTTYALLGPKLNFQILYMAISRPDDVTTNQKKNLLEWINRVQAILPDSLNKKK